MCGIVGFNWEDQRQIRLLASLLNHRGPEQEGFHVADGVSIGHKRLRIIDLSEKGRQPIYNEDKTVCVSFNGEIFNFEQIKSDLEKAGHRFESHTDTEVLVHGWEEWGTEILGRLNGQFAFCIFDRKKNLLFLARDRFGIKPLYYYSQNGRFIFGSELKVFLKSDIKKEISRHALDYYLLFGNTPSEQSILEGVQKLPAAHYLVYDLTARKIQNRQRYWDVSFDQQIDCGEDELKKQIVGRLERSVKMQLISDVPLGAFLSGGVDSSIIVSIMRKYVKELNTFSIKFDRPEFNESHYAKIVSDKFQTIHHEIEFNAANVRELIDEFPYYYDEPFGDPSMIPTSLVCRVARQHVTVSLSGTGGDEIFGGYPRYNRFHMVKHLNHLPTAAKFLLKQGVVMAHLFFKIEGYHRWLEFFGRRQPDHILYLQLFNSMFPSKEQGIEMLSRYDYYKKHFRYDDITNAMNCDIHEYLPDDLLVKEDRASMAVALEARVPFLDHEFVEFTAKIPPYFKTRRGQKKYILKKAYEEILPHEILYRPKQGFGVPLAHYFRNELKDYTAGQIFDFDAVDYYDKNRVIELWRLHQTGRWDYSRLFWNIMMFNLWYKKWMM
ncbi:MAG: asparagine synthase (glutamine-hydrolyzing) [Phycisphaerae bacterium]|jgi:asparagine synthase (glutamine-hydrolysing)